MAKSYIMIGRYKCIPTICLNTFLIFVLCFNNVLGLCHIMEMIVRHFETVTPQGHSDGFP